MGASNIHLSDQRFHYY